MPLSLSGLGFLVYKMRRLKRIHVLGLKYYDKQIFWLCRVKQYMSCNSTLPIKTFRCSGSSICLANGESIILWHVFLLLLCFFFFSNLVSPILISKYIPNFLLQFHPSMQMFFLNNITVLFHRSNNLSIVDSLIVLWSSWAKKICTLPWINLWLIFYHLVL